MSEEQLANKIARNLWAMSSKKREINMYKSLKNEQFQRTMTDEYDSMFRTVPVQGRFYKDPPEVQEMRQKLMLDNKTKKPVEDDNTILEKYRQIKVLAENEPQTDEKCPF